MRCTNCGTECKENETFCPVCGKVFSSAATSSNYSGNGYSGGGYSRNDYSGSSYSNSEDYIPPEYKPISMWGYFGYELLFSIPCIGFVILLVFAFGGTQNVNLKNFARSYFCFTIVFVVLVVLLSSCGALASYY